MMLTMDTLAQQVGDIAGTRGDAAVTTGGTVIYDVFKRGEWPMYILAVMSFFGLAESH